MKFRKQFVYLRIASVYILRRERDCAYFFTRETRICRIARESRDSANAMLRPINLCACQQPGNVYLLPSRAKDADTISWFKCTLKTRIARPGISTTLGNDLPVRDESHIYIGRIYCIIVYTMQTAIPSLGISPCFLLCFFPSFTYN